MSLMLNLPQAAKTTVTKIRNLLARGVLQNTDDQKKTQILQAGLMADEVATDLEHPQEYGFTSRALDGAEVLVAFHGGNRDNATVLIVSDKRKRPLELEKGEVKIWNHEGTEIHLKNNNEIIIKSDQKLTINCPETKINGKLHVTQNITCDADIKDSVRTMAADRNIYNTHTHPGDSGGTTSTPTQQQ